mgnify:FL=1
MKSFKYPTCSLRGDYLRATVGLLVTVGLLIAATKITIFQYLFAAGAILFLGFFLRTAQRHLTVFHIANGTLYAQGPFGSSIQLCSVTDIQLRYFSTRKDRNGEGGWFELTIKCSKSKISIDSTITGFEQIMQTCKNIIQENKLTPSETTVDNFSSAGFGLENQTSFNNDLDKNQDPV